MSSNIMSLSKHIASTPTGLNSIDIALRRSFRAIEALLPNGYVSKSLTAPPASLTENDKYIVAANATGAWEGHDNQIAYYDLANKYWEFYEPITGQLAVIDGAINIYDGKSWSESSSGGGGGVTIGQVNDAISAALTDYVTQADVTSISDQAKTYTDQQYQINADKISALDARVTALEGA